MYKGKKVLVVAPCYNEETKIGEVVRRVSEMDVPLVDEMLVVDDGSTDRSVEVARQRGANVIELGACIGVGAVFRTGIDYACQNDFDICVCIAGNNKDEPNEIPRLLDPIIDEDYDFIQGSRHLPGGVMGNTPLYRRIATRVHPFLFSLFVGKRLSESTNGFRALRVEMLRDPRIHLHQSWLNGYELEPYLLFRAIRLGYKHSEVPCTKIYPPKKLGQTKMTPIVGWWSIMRPVFLLGFGLRQ